MDQNEKRILRETLEIAKENNEMLKKMRRGQFIGNVARIFYWVIILGASFGAYYFIQPYIEMYKSLLFGH